MAAPKPVLAMNQDRLKIFAGNANRPLAEEICAALNKWLGEAMVKVFADGEIYVQINENVRGADVFVIQPAGTPVDRHLMELLLMIDALKRSSAERITAVLPYYGYARQDRKDKPRVPISAKLIASLIERAGADRILALDLHAAQIQGFFDVPVDHLFAAPVMIDYFKPQETPHLTVVSPDAGGVERARAFATRLRVPLAIIDKRREDAETVEVMNVIGEIAGRTCIIVDDMIDTGGTLVNVAQTLKEKGAEKVFACCAHGVFAKDAIAKICDSPLERVVVTDSIPLSQAGRQCSRI